MEGDPRNPRVSLLKKYDIPIDHLSYEYVEKCSNKKDLERIVRILRSGEEGSYPDLLKVAEERLRLFSPESRVLRVEAPILTKESLTQEEWRTVENELLSWEKEMSVMDKSLDFEKSRVKTVGNKNLPGVRKVAQSQPKSEKIKVTISNNMRIKSGDYAAWDKFDVDKELLKIDVEEERKMEEKEKKQREAKKLQNKKKIEILDVDKENYSLMEQQVLANQAKDRGNECYKFGDLESALKYYEVSIRLHPTVNSYNNRAMTYLKLKQYENAIKDCNKVLQMEKKNIKALHRRATAYQNMPTDRETNNYDQLALQDLYEIVYLEPNNKVAQADLQKLKKKLNIEDVGKKFRMQISEEVEKKENCEPIQEKNLSTIEINKTSVEKLPLTYYGPSTSTFQCEPYSMMHRALSGSSVPGQVLCKCNSNRSKQNPLCQKCGEAMCTPKLTKAEKSPRGAASAATRDAEAKNQLSEKQTSEPLKINTYSSDLSNKTKEKTNEDLLISNSRSVQKIEKEHPQQKGDSEHCKNKINNDAGSNLQLSTANGLTMTSLVLEEVSKQEDLKEKPLTFDQNVSNLDKNGNNKVICTEITENKVTEAVEAQRKASGKEVLKEVESVCLNNSGVLMTENNSNKDNSQNTKKSKHKKKKSKEREDNKILRKHFEPLKIEPVKVVHAAKYLHPTSVEPKVKSEPSVQSQQETNVASSTHYKAFIPNRKCYSSETNRITSTGVAPFFASKEIPKQVTSSYSSFEGNKENISECRCNSNIENEGKKSGTEEAVDSPFEFMKTWEELKKFDESYTKRAEILRRIRPSDLGKVIGIKLDSDMLSCLLECLLRHFIETDPKRVIELLNQLPKVPRYGLVSMFLADTDKKKMRELIDTAESKGFKLDEDVKKNLTITS